MASAVDVSLAGAGRDGGEKGEGGFTKKRFAVFRSISVRQESLHVW